ncbi:MAG: hypothetical protein R3E12_05915 [Candidatus Eisenbacteria bacterium]|uniref:Uncharacterized protein n=1 Tax=Eiseniibacteriota bacterium TaxID=2212470 RepID=A0A956LXF5_UNCEI|nr:hypothetical protein [Candidatus Eisenbacteria bacterium]
MDREKLSTIESQLARIHGVLSVRLRTRDDEPAELHALVLEGSGVRRTQIQSALFGGFGIELDLERIHIVELAPDEDEASARIRFHSVNVYRESHRVEAQVELHRDGAAFVGTADGAAIRDGIPRIVAAATLQALRKLVGEDLALELLALEARRLGGRRLMLSHLVLLRGREETHLTGSVLVAQDPLEAVVFSLLDALNRVLPTLESELVEFEVEPLFEGARG